MMYYFPLIITKHYISSVVQSVNVHLWTTSSPTPSRCIEKPTCDSSRYVSMQFHVFVVNPFVLRSKSFMQKDKKNRVLEEAISFTLTHSVLLSTILEEKKLEEKEKCFETFLFFALFCPEFLAHCSNVIECDVQFEFPNTYKISTT